MTTPSDITISLENMTTCDCHFCAFKIAIIHGLKGMGIVILCVILFAAFMYLMDFITQEQVQCNYRQAYYKWCMETHDDQKHCLGKYVFTTCKPPTH